MFFFVYKETYIFSYPWGEGHVLFNKISPIYDMATLMPSKHLLSIQNRTGIIEQPPTPLGKNLFKRNNSCVFFKRE